LLKRREAIATLKKRHCGMRLQGSRSDLSLKPAIELPKSKTAESPPRRHAPLPCPLGPQNYRKERQQCGDHKEVLQKVISAPQDERKKLYAIPHKQEEGGFRKRLDQQRVSNVVVRNRTVPLHPKGDGRSCAYRRSHCQTSKRDAGLVVDRGIPRFEHRKRSNLSWDPVIWHFRRTERIKKTSMVPDYSDYGRRLSV